MSYARSPIEVFSMTIGTSIWERGAVSVFIWAECTPGDSTAQVFRELQAEVGRTPTAGRAGAAVFFQTSSISFAVTSRRVGVCRYGNDCFYLCGGLERRIEMSACLRGVALRHVNFSRGEGLRRFFEPRLYLYARIGGKAGIQTAEELLGCLNARFCRFPVSFCRGLVSLGTAAVLCLRRESARAYHKCRRFGTRRAARFRSAFPVENIFAGNQDGVYVRPHLRSVRDVVLVFQLLLIFTRKLYVRIQIRVELRTRRIIEFARECTRRGLFEAAFGTGDLPIGLRFRRYRKRRAHLFVYMHFDGVEHIARQGALGSRRRAAADCEHEYRGESRH